jgi:CRISPR/Cas system Type II protein with McrA/HNH and RuvC-like nuclease domain
MSRISHQELLIAQKGKCFYCFLPMGLTRGNNNANYTLDHFIPKCQSRKTRNNAVLAHAKCNLEKGHRMPTKAERIRFKNLYKKIHNRRNEVKQLAKEL